MAFAVASVKRNVLASWFAHAVTIVVGFFLMPYVMKVLGDHSYGTWVFVNSLASYAGLLYFGFGDTISRYVARHHAEGDHLRVNQVVNLVLAIYLAMGGVALVIGGALCAVAPWLSSWQDHELLEVRLTILVLALNVATGLAGSVFGGVLMGLRRFDLERGVSFFSDLLRLTLIVVFLRQEWGILTIAIIYWFITACENLAYLVMAYRCLPEMSLGWKYVSKDVLRDCSSFSSMAFVNAIAYQMTYATDSVVIGMMMGTDAIVPYYVALRLTQFLRQPIDKIATICMPTAGALSADADRHRLHKFLLQAVGVVFLLSGSVFVGSWYFGGRVIETWVGGDYGQSHHLLMILLGAQIVSLPCGVLRAFLFGLGEVKWPAVLYLCEAVCNLSLSIVLCSYWGQVGVAWGTAIPVILLELGILLPIALSLLKMSPARLWQRSILPQLLPITLLWYYCYFISQQSWVTSSWPVLIGVSAGGAAIVGAGWLLTQKLPTARTIASGATVPM
jgi:O-antigen/teichoic acid export membrane protein